MATGDQAVERAFLVDEGRLDPNQAVTRLALFDAEGNSINPGNIGADIAVSDLTDVSGEPSEGDVLQFDGEVWIPYALPTGNDIQVGADLSESVDTGDVEENDPIAVALARLQNRLAVVEAAIA